jgi:hypothetical protein
MNTDLISEVANKISLGFYNAWDHETSIRRAIDGSDPEIYSEQFFQAYLRKEFARAWRNHDCFSLMAISWEASDHDSASCEKQFVKLLQNSLRSSDLVARGELAKFWVLLPDTAADEAQCAAQRLTLASHEHTRGQNPLRIGVTEFSRHTPTQSALLQEALAAMQDASDTAQSIVISKVSSAAGQ